ncbi:uncharacterized protein LY79DRAFT_135075 [Colletotrichum navitas]|uniref:Secreted protein n=1 Tax=Colletotrichum navitas TaxID=681940 RepID=A0AAD8Q2N4_9PEZI|nr:uncharacterized protein LY79DRAFT_135075 [Colletotrichum navitas]KAK1594623.1 hypothetical protein LY79DRAFT_135075 [Colletotrichum navitas]
MRVAYCLLATMTYSSAVMTVRSQREVDPRRTGALATHLPFTMLGQMKSSDSWTLPSAPVPTKLAHQALVADTGCPNLRVQVNLTGRTRLTIWPSLFVHPLRTPTHPAKTSRATVASTDGRWRPDRTGLAT